MNHSLNVTMSLSGMEIDWQQPVEIVSTPGVDGDWRLRDPESDLTVSGESYLDTRRLLSVARRVKERTKQACERALQRELREAAAVRGGIA